MPIAGLRIVAIDRARDLAQVVRRNVGRHADADARGAVERAAWAGARAAASAP